MEEHDWQKQMRQDPRSTAELISLALTAADEEAAWQPIQILHYRGSREVFDGVRPLTRSDCPRERELAANVLGQLGVPDHVYPEEAIGLLLDMLQREQEPEVLSAIGVALGHQQSPRAAAPLAQLRHHANPDVRWSVAYGLAGLEDQSAVDALIELSADRDADVRVWATFALGTQIDLDTPALREALTQRMDDPDEDTRREAIFGLARRGDQQAIELAASIEKEQS